MASSPDPVTALDRPVSSLTLDAYTTLCFGLTMSQGLGGRNWEGIAGIVGFKTDQVMAMKNHLGEVEQVRGDRKEADLCSSKLENDGLY